MEDFSRKRKDFFSHIPEFWPDLYNEEYALYDVKDEKKETIDEIRTATERIGHLFFKTVPLLQNLEDDVLLQLGFPASTLFFLKSSSPLNVPSVIARADLIVKEGKIKLLELNADTPTFIKETFFVNGKVCEHFGVQNPNEGCEGELKEAIKEAVSQSFRCLHKSGPPNIVFTSHEDDMEDFYTTKYLLDLSSLPAHYVPLQNLKIVIEDEKEIARGIYDPFYQKIDVLYRQTYPLEHLILDKDDSNEAVGEALMRLVNENKLSIINPSAAFLLQSKAVQALIWGLHETKHSFFTKEEHTWISTYFLPTYLDSAPFREREKAFVQKPAFGREGDTVEIYSEKGENKSQNPHHTYDEYLSVYQQYESLPVSNIQTIDGVKEARIMYGCFLVSGKASAIGIRAGGEITDNGAYFLPVAQN